MERFSVTLYGTRKVGFTFLLSNGAGLVATSGPGSDYKVPGSRGQVVASIDEAVRCALRFVPGGVEIMVHAPGSGRVIRHGFAHQGELVKFSK